jgi:hypothetical protein|tara:strand:+ start:236 stop:445 length:210 start_codon:yes stop_codon:yes gene_type:complete
MAENSFSILETGSAASQKSVKRAGGSIENMLERVSGAGGGGSAEKALVASNSAQATPETGKGNKVNISA